MTHRYTTGNKKPIKKPIDFINYLFTLYTKFN